jgi:DNA-binding NarL/FixJ family response regulator
MALKAQNRKKSQIVVVDDHPVLRDGLTQLICGQLDLECAGMADDTVGAKRLVEQCSSIPR